jgi:aspartyl-tRNA(Asn)/glutamyl-tRNA(Gln) amidotransferase subunit A
LSNPVATLDHLSHALADGRVTSRALAEACLERIQDPKGEGARVFVHVDADAVRKTADALDAQRGARAVLSRFAGIPISIKDLFDIQGDVTRAGSKALADAPAAKTDATVVARLRRAGFLLMGRTNMTEFAYSGLGINPHYGTPANPWQRETPRVPGGSSSGAGVSVADGMAHAALGTDTGGSCRIPAAFTGIVGYKPTARLIPQTGIVPLSPSLDAAGPLARSVRCCASLHAILSGEDEFAVPELPLAGLRLAIPQTIALDELEEPVARAFEAAVTKLSQAGAKIIDTPFSAFSRVPPLNAKGGLSGMESYTWHRALIAAKRGSYDPRVLSRILRGADCSAADYLDVVAGRKTLIQEAEAQLEAFDALILPTVATVPPRIADLATDDAYGRANALSLRNTTLINMIDGCAISLPIHRTGDAPVGLMLACRGGADHRLFALSAAVESLVATPQ